MAPLLFTVGHSNHELEVFLGLLRRHEVTAVADVRSGPGSSYSPHFNREPLEAGLAQCGIRYVYLGEELGARRSELGCYADGRVKFDLVARSPLFHRGLERVRRGAAGQRIALLCAEKDPLMCHRAILICRHLRRDLDIRHILEDGRLEAHADAELRLLDLLGLPRGDLLSSVEEMIELAYDQQGERIAWSPPPIEEQIEA
jgi:uncharacterized protein (DUF488 family)